MKLIEPFRTIKRVTSQFFELVYWTMLRRIPNDWFDDDVGKYVPGEKTNAFQISRNTWDGEQSIVWYLTDIRLPHMFYNMLKCGNHRYCYLDSFMFNDKYCLNKTDRAWAINYMYKTYLVSPVKTEHFYGSNVKHTDWYRDSKGVLLTDNEKNKNSIHCWLNDVLIGHAKIESDYVSYWLRAKNDYFGQGDTELKYSVGHFDKGDFITDFNLQDFNVELIQSLLNEHNINISNFVEEMFQAEQVFDVEPKDYNLLSPEIKKSLRGNRKTLVGILTLRRLLKKAVSIDSLDDKYNITDKEYKNLNKEERDKLFEEKYQLYKDDKKAAYREVADFFAENAGGWWD